MSAQETEDVYLEAVRVLTVAGRHQGRFEGRPDFAGFLAAALVATAANLGGIDQLVAGRPGCWEAGLVEQFVKGTVGEDPVDLARWRTEPLVVRLNVAELIADGCRHPGLFGLSDQLDEIDEHQLLQASTYEKAVSATELSYSQGYRAYRLAFADTVRIQATSLGLSAGTVVVEVDDDPMSQWWQEGAVRDPDEWGGDELSHVLWTYAHSVVSLPNAGVRLQVPSVEVTDDHE